MANKRDSNSQKRSRDNRAQREALKARTAAAGTPRPSRAAPATNKRAPGARGPVRSTADEESTTTATTKGGRPRRERPPRPGDRPVDIATLEGSFFRKVAQVPGGSQVISATLVTLLATVFTCYLAIFTKSANTDELVRGDKGFVADATQVQVYGYVGLVVPMVIVVLMMAFALSRSLTPGRRRAWFFGALIIGIIGLQAAQLHILAAGMLGYAYFKASKVEGPEPLLGGRFGRRRSASEPVETTGGEASEG